MYSLEKLDLSSVDEHAVAVMGVLLDHFAETRVRRDGSPTGFGRKIANNGGSQRLLDRFTGELDTPVTKKNAQCWVRAYEEAVREEIPMAEEAAPLAEACREALA